MLWIGSGVEKSLSWNKPPLSGQRAQTDPQAMVSGVGVDRGMRFRVISPSGD